MPVSPVARSARIDEFTDAFRLVLVSPRSFLTPMST
jgi:hypothetical protein